MVFVALSKNDNRYIVGREIRNNRFEIKHEAKLFFYDRPSIEVDFADYGFIEANEINKPVKPLANKPIEVFWQIISKKELVG
ncbi:hypothetical protein [Mangrovimonas aestuarii]|uniref:hypothetical protein n=1 Tax=Mangrovimonas aestuarii TaxID=3018443 RepID=UPI002377EE24|nr:hypothetical protein [Mangrovimonas aestuarii]